MKAPDFYKAGVHSVSERDLSCGVLRADVGGENVAQVERMRLSAGASWRGHPTREQQVLHYQWFADLGSAEAQRALGQMLTTGVQRDPEQAFRYFRSATGTFSSSLTSALVFLLLLLLLLHMTC